MLKHAAWLQCRFAFFQASGLTLPSSSTSSFGKGKFSMTMGCKAVAGTLVLQVCLQLNCCRCPAAATLQLREKRHPGRGTSLTCPKLLFAIGTLLPRTCILKERCIGLHMDVHHLCMLSVHVHMTDDRCVHASLICKGPCMRK